MKAILTVSLCFFCVGIFYRKKINCKQFNNSLSLRNKGHILKGLCNLPNIKISNCNIHSYKGDSFPLWYILVCSSTLALFLPIWGFSDPQMELMARHDLESVAKVKRQPPQWQQQRRALGLRNHTQRTEWGQTSRSDPRADPQTPRPAEPQTPRLPETLDLEQTTNAAATTTTTTNAPMAAENTSNTPL